MAKKKTVWQVWSNAQQQGGDFTNENTAMRRADRLAKGRRFVQVVKLEGEGYPKSIARWRDGERER